MKNSLAGIHSRGVAFNRGSVLIVVLWTTIALVSVALLFADSMRLEYRAADNSISGMAASQAIEGARRYLTCFLANLEEPGTIPDPETYGAERVPVGDAAFWVLGRGDERDSVREPVFSLVDESSKLNLNTASQEMLEALPGMTAGLAAAIVDWRDTDSEVTPGGAESETYLLREPKYTCKDSPFETIEELRLVAGANWEILYGEDANLNGVLDPNEDDGDESPPDDNRNGILDSGLLEYVTVYSREPNKQADGSARVNITNDAEGLRRLLEETLGRERASQIAEVRNARSVLEYYIRSGLTEEEFAQVADGFTASASDYVEGLVNANTASETVLACLPGIGEEYASQIVAGRQGRSEEDETLAWVTGILDENGAIEAGPHLTTRSYQLSADVAAVGHEGRGFRREVMVVDTSGEKAAVVFRRDRSRLGWPLTNEVRKELILGEEETREFR